MGRYFALGESRRRLKDVQMELTADEMQQVLSMVLNEDPDRAVVGFPLLLDFSTGLMVRVVLRSPFPQPAQVASSSAGSLRGS